MDPLSNECPQCDQQPGEECRWGIFDGHPRFHAMRVEMAASLFGMKQADRVGAVDPQLVDKAITAAVDKMF